MDADDDAIAGGRLVAKSRLCACAPAPFVRLLAFPFPLFNKRLLATTAQTTRVVGGAKGRRIRSGAVPIPCTLLRAKKKPGVQPELQLELSISIAIQFSAGRGAETVFRGPLLVLILFLLQY